MKITRTVNGQELEFELTPDEMYEAYLEKQYQFDMDNVSDFIQWHFDGVIPGPAIVECIADREWIKDTAAEVRRCVNKYETEYNWQLQETVVDAMRARTFKCVFDKEDIR